MCAYSLIESEILAPPIVFKRSIDRAQVMNSAIIEKLLFISHGTMIGGQNPWKNSRIVTSPRDSLRRTVPVPKEHHHVEYRHSRVADILQIGWETNTSYAECGQLSI